MIRVLSVLVVLAATMFYAGSIFAENVWHTGVKIKRVYPLASGDFILILDQDHPNCTSTEDPHYYHVKVGNNGVTQEGSEKLYSAALTAAASRATVNINFNDSVSKCYVNRLQVVY